MGKRVSKRVGERVGGRLGERVSGRVREGVSESEHTLWSPARTSARDAFKHRSIDSLVCKWAGGWAGVCVCVTVWHTVSTR